MVDYLMSWFYTETIDEKTNIDIYYYNKPCKYCSNERLCIECNDKGWGCVYRNCQTLLSMLKMTVPSMTELYKYMSNNKYTDFNKWIEPQHIKEYLMDEYKMDSKLVLFNYEFLKKYDKKDYVKINDKTVFVEKIKSSLDNKKPVLIDNGTYSYLIFKYVNDDFYVIDPHKWTETSKMVKKFELRNSYIALFV